MTPFLSMVVSFVLCIMGGFSAMVCAITYDRNGEKHDTNTLAAYFFALTLFVIASIV